MCMDLIYFFPSGNDSPANVAKKTFENLLNSSARLPFSEIKLYCGRKDSVDVKSKFRGVEVITSKELCQISSDSLLHIPTQLLIFPNSKFLLYMYCKFIKKTKIIIQCHGNLRRELLHKGNILSLIHLLSFIFIPNLLRSADLVVTHSYNLKNSIQRYGVKNCVVVPNAIDPFWFQPLTNNSTFDGYSFNQNSHNIFYHGRLSWEKGVDLLIEALGAFVKINPNVTLYLAGEGPQKKNLKKLCSKLSLDKNVVFLGNLNREHIKYFLKNVDIAIYPSRFDTFPLAILEALACSECPVYLSRKAGISDFAIHSKYNLCYFEPTIGELINILNTEFIDVSDEILIMQKEFAKKYQWNNIVSDYHEIYTKLLSSERKT